MRACKQERSFPFQASQVKTLASQAIKDQTPPKSSKMHHHSAGEVFTVLTHSTLFVSALSSPESNVEALSGVFGFNATSQLSDLFRHDPRRP